MQISSEGIETASKPQVINSVIESDKLSSNEIDTQTCQLLNDGKDIFVLNEKNLKDANPDLIISQETFVKYVLHILIK